MKIIRNFIAAAGLVGLLGCGETELPKEKITEIGTKEVQIDPTPIVVTPENDCQEKRDTLYDKMLKTNGTELQVLNHLLRKNKDYKKIIKQNREYFAEDEHDVAYDLVFNLAFDTAGTRSDINKAKKDALYQSAKELAYCLNPGMNFEQAVVEAGYKNATDDVRSGSIEKVIKNSLIFAKEVASKNDIDDSSYAKQFIIDAYASALYHLENGYVGRMIQTDLKFAEKIAKDRKINDDLYARNFVDNACEIAKKHHERGLIHVTQDLQFARKIALRVEDTSIISKIDALEATLK